MNINISINNFISFLPMPAVLINEKGYIISANNLYNQRFKFDRISYKNKVLLQTFQPDHPTIQQVIHHDYNTLYDVQIKERTAYHYPPYCRLIRVTFKNKNYDTVNTAATWFTNVFIQSYRGTVLGPVFPSVARVRNLYNKHLMIKLDSKQSHTQVKKILLKTHISFQSIAAFRSTRVNFDVDPY